MSGFDKLQSNLGENTFVGWVGESGTVQIERLTDTEIIDDILRLINNFTSIEPPLPRRYFM